MHYLMNIIWVCHEYYIRKWWYILGVIFAQMTEWVAMGSCIMRHKWSWRDSCFLISHILEACCYICEFNCSMDWDVWHMKWNRDLFLSAHKLLLYSSVAADGHDGCFLFSVLTVWHIHVAMRHLMNRTTCSSTPITYCCYKYTMH